MKTKCGYYFYAGIENDTRQYEGWGAIKNRVEKNPYPKLSTFV